MRNPLAPEAMLGTVVLLVCVPIAGALAYIFARGVPDMVRAVVDVIMHPERHLAEYVSIAIYALWAVWFARRKARTADFRAEAREVDR